MLLRISSKFTRGSLGGVSFLLALSLAAPGLAQEAEKTDSPESAAPIESSSAAAEATQSAPLEPEEGKAETPSPLPSTPGTPLLRVVSQNECTLQVVLEDRPGVRRGAVVGIYDANNEIKAAGRITQLDDAMRMRMGARVKKPKPKNAKGANDAKDTRAANAVKADVASPEVGAKPRFSVVRKGTLELAPGASGRCVQMTAYLEAKLADDVPQRLRPRPLPALVAFDASSGLHIGFWSVREETRATGSTSMVSAWAALPRAESNLYALRASYVHEILSVKEGKKISSFAPSTDGKLTQGVVELSLRVARFFDPTQRHILFADVGVGRGVFGSLVLSEGDLGKVDVQTDRRVLVSAGYEHLLFRGLTLGTTLSYAGDASSVKGLDGDTASFQSHGARALLGLGWRID